MAERRGRGPCLGPSVKFCWKRFLYVIKLLQIWKKIPYIVKLSLFQTVIFIFSNFCEKYFEKIRKRKIAQGRVPSPTLCLLE